MKRIAAIAFMFAAALLQTGCASAEKDHNMSERPWNAPKNWEHGLPAGMMNQQY